MKYDKVTILGVVVCVLSFFGILWFQRPQQRTLKTEPLAVQPQNNPGEPGQTAPADGTANEMQPAATAGANVPEQPAAAQGAPSQMAAIPAVPAVSGLPVGPDAPWTESPAQNLKTLTQADTMNCTIDALQGGVVRIELLKYARDKQKNGEESPRVELGSADYPYMALNKAVVAQLNLQPAEAATGVKADDASVELTRWNADKTLKVTERWTIDQEHKYQLGYEITVENKGAQTVELPAVMVEGGAMPPSVSARKEDGGGAAFMPFDKHHAKLLDPKQLAKLSSAYAIMQDPNAMEGDKVKAQAGVSKVLGGAVRWGGVHSKYFLMLIWNMGNEGFARFDTFTCNAMEKLGGMPNGRYRSKVLLPAAKVEAGAAQTWKLHGYAGPKDSKLLHAMKNGMDGIMGMDRFFWGNPSWMGWISRILLDCLVWFSKIFPASSGYGWAVIVLTLAVKLIFWPLTQKSTRSMRKMQELKPQLDALKEKFKDDPQMMYRKQQELFKENNVSQLGGCLPMVFQIPVFFALFNTFRSAIELRHAGFLWVADLSMPDTVFSIGNIPCNPLAILMGLTMVLQQKMTPSADPQQGKMMMFMSIFFIWIFYSMPSALTLYMTVNQLLSIAQTYWGKKSDSKKSGATAAAAA